VLEVVGREEAANFSLEVAEVGQELVLVEFDREHVPRGVLVDEDDVEKPYRPRADEVAQRGRDLAVEWLPGDVMMTYSVGPMVMRAPPVAGLPRRTP